jgi:hypothetical protein
MQKNIDVNKLSRVSDLVKRQIKTGSFKAAHPEELASHVSLEMLANRQHTQRVKNSTELFREYELEKWSIDLQRIMKVQSISSGNIHEIYISENQNMLIRVFDQLYISDLLSVRTFLIDSLEILLAELLAESSALLDVGSGTGATLIPLISQMDVKKLQIYATDLSPSGLLGLSRIAKMLDFEIRTCVQDLAEGLKLDFAIPIDSLILTSFSLSCLPNIPYKFFEDIISLSPKYVVHVESMYENLDSEFELDQYAKQYIEQNDYNRNLMSQLADALRMHNDYEIKWQTPVFLGQNPLFPLSIICWGKK